MTITTTEWKVRQNLKLLMAVMSLIGITGMYLRQVRRTGLVGLVGYVIFGIALLRANVLARWAAALLAVGAFATLAIPLLPQVNERLFAVPTGVALIGLGYSLWRDQRTPAARPVASPASSPLHEAGTK